MSLLKFALTQAADSANNRFRTTNWIADCLEQAIARRNTVRLFLVALVVICNCVFGLIGSTPIDNGAYYPLQFVMMSSIGLFMMLTDSYLDVYSNKEQAALTCAVTMMFRVQGLVALAYCASIPFWLQMNPVLLCSLVVLGFMYYLACYLGSAKQQLLTQYCQSMTSGGQKTWKEMFSDANRK